ncbi:MAG TPA: universal stress protein [Alphaproteobacteria bacterium]|nr:universal stress protein [Alphaproteobacteria bacterium]
MRALALLDRSIYGRSVISYAAWLAAPAGGRVDLLNVVSPAEIAAGRLAIAGTLTIGASPGLVSEVAVDTDDEAQRLAASGEVLLEAARHDLIESGVTDVHHRVVSGDLAETVAAAIDGADVLVLGKRGEHADLARLPLGSNLERLARQSPIPVLAVPRSYRPVRRLLVAFDTDPSGLATVDALAAGGIVPPMPCLLLHVGSPNPQMDEAIGAARQKLAAAGFETTAEMAEGTPERSIAERVVTADVDLVAIGAFGRSRLGSLLFGSLTSEVIRASQTPVLLCRAA